MFFSNFSIKINLVITLKLSSQKAIFLALRTKEKFRKVSEIFIYGQFFYNEYKKAGSYLLPPPIPVMIRVKEQSPHMLLHSLISLSVRHRITFFLVLDSYPRVIGG